MGNAGMKVFKGHPGIYLLAVALAAVAISACAPIRESETPLAIYMEVYVGELDASHPAVRIMDIQKLGEADTRYIPSPSARNLWLRPGNYEATFECFRPQTDPYNVPILKMAAPPDSNGHVRFTVEYHGEVESRYAEEYNRYKIDCATSPDGKPEFVVQSMLDVIAD
jgi:hypothetical protein